MTPIGRESSSAAPAPRPRVVRSWLPVRAFRTAVSRASFASWTVITLVLASCSSPTDARRDEPPASIEIVSGDRQSAVVGTELTLPLVVKVLAENGRGLRDQRVSFTVIAGGGAVTPSAVLSDEQGVVQARWMLGTSMAESQRVAARVASGAADAALRVNFDAIALTGPAATLRKVAGDGQSVEAGTSPTDALVVKVLDRFDNAVSNVVVDWSVVTGGGTLAPATATTDAEGVAKARWTLPVAGKNTASATVTGVAPVTFDVTVTPAPGVRLAFASTNAGYFYSCAVATSGAAYCWGNNSYGQLGDGTTAQRATATAVAGGLTFTSVSAGVFQTCGVTTDRRVYCWGGGYGATPVAVDGGVGFVAVTVGFQHACGLTAGGAAYCWGDNWLGALGTGDLAGRSAPAPVAGGLMFASLSAGWDFTCGITTGGAGYCWGRGEALGSTARTACDYSDADGGWINCNPEPAPIEGGHTFSQIGTGELFACALTADGAAFCWGPHSAGAESNAPVAVPAGLTFTSLGVDAARACGVATGGTVFCWGWIPIQGSLSAPTLVGGDVTFATVSVGWFHSCGVASSGAAYCWGRNDSGELGDGSHAASASPVKVVTPP